LGPAEYCVSAGIASKTLQTPSDLQAVAGSQGQSCDDVCGAKGLRCDARFLSNVNTCEKLTAAFPCKRDKCTENFGHDQPAYVSNPANMEMYGEFRSHSSWHAIRFFNSVIFPPPTNHPSLLHPLAHSLPPSLPPFPCPSTSPRSNCVGIRTAHNHWIISLSLSPPQDNAWSTASISTFHVPVIMRTRAEYVHAGRSQQRRS
jgi:hypothetical protein